MPGRRGQAEDRHVAVDALGVTDPHPVRLVPDPDVARRPDRLVERTPGRQVRLFRRAGEPVQVLGRPPVLDQDRLGQRVGVHPEQPLGRVGLQYPQHLRHGLGHRPPLVDAPELVHPHADHEDDDLVVDLGGEPPGHDRGHRDPSLCVSCSDCEHCSQQLRGPYAATTRIANTVRSAYDDCVMTATPTRRERLRERTIAEIKAAALDRIRHSGAAGLSLRAVAGDLGMSPAGLYRYYDSRDDLLSDLIVDGFTAVAEAVAAASKPEPGLTVGDRLLAGSAAYRDWALAHTQEFALIYGEPVPGFRAPEAGPVDRASGLVGLAFLSLFAEAEADGTLRIPSEMAAAAAADPYLSCSPELPGIDLSPAGLAVALGAWARLHGLVMLELFGHFNPMVGRRDALFTATLKVQIDELGMPRGA
jgi:AcrR family transcriptional regulator